MRVRARRTGVGLLAVAAVLISAAPAEATPLFTASQVLAPTGNGINQGLSMQMYGGRIPDLATAQMIARSHSTISLGPAQLNGFGPAMKQANPNLRIFLYMNGMYAGASQGSLFPISWYMHAADGSTIQSVGYGNYLMDPRSTASYTNGGVTYAGWADWVARKCKAQLTAAGVGAADGCFVDMLGSAPLSPGYNQGGKVPVADASGTLFSAATWYQQITGPVADHVERYTGKPVLANGIGSGRRYFGTATGPSRLLLDYATAGDAEVWLRSPGQALTVFPTDAAWRQEVQMLNDSSTLDRGVNATVKTWTSGTTAQIEQWRRFSLGSFLIGNQGHATYEFSASMTQVAWSDDSPLYHLALGTPTQSYASVASYLHDGVYTRAFTNGEVLVNAGSAPVTVTLPGTCYTVDRQAVTQVTVQPHDAVILTLS
jgi:putative glycosyl hydrolase-like family 15 (GHL15) protein